ncbi:hypothetical protein CYMTET_6570 [Cymbomonas tetramitiformis]|uniref:CEMIP beta-helix domain-containing protein n=1 Tax=Cymbomonas tetramitiformis TaxID=36881 RepID=A0AAE0LHX8_9CHLO|nr:hypothetical protein CYMTET_6570 [Cymbomonas tetramitiformis]
MAEYVNEFMSVRSMGYNGVSGVGIDAWGNFVDESKYYKPILKGYGIRTKDAMLRWPLTYPAGHPAHESGWGVLGATANWQEYVNDFDKINLTSLDGYDEAARLEGSVLVVEATGADVTVPVVLSRSATRLLGIVVRRGGVLFMDDIDSELDLHFMIVESGGLFQASARHSAAHHFMSKLVITYEHDQWGDGGNAPLTASQYSVEVLHPGVKLEPTYVVYHVKNNGTTTTYNVSKQVRDFSGAVANNHGVAKGLAVFFNGNYQLNAVIPGGVRYAGTWSVDRTCPSSQHCRMDVRETVREAEAPLGEDEDAYHVAAEYPMTWARLGRPHYVGDWYLVLNAEDCSHDGWRTDERLVLTAAPTQFADRDTDSFTSAPRIWMDHDPNSTAYRDNEKALHDHDRHFSDDRAGVEVVTVQAALNRTTYLLRRPLRFDHYVGIERLSNHDQQADVHVGTHAALLTRGIVVRSALSGSGGGCNNLASQVDHPRNGGEGFVVENNEDDIDSRLPNERDISHCMNIPKTTRTLYPPKPSWLHDTSHLVAGCNTLFGAEQKFRYGASVSLDGVEMRQLGTAPNFGRLGTYGVHFHVAGYPRSFTGYLRNSSHTRELRVVSSGIWMSFARYVVVHGTMETLVRNNVGLLACGSGYFCEDGTELDNIFDHNTGISTLSTIANPYWNPAPMFSFVSTDYSVMSTFFWFKN